MPKKNDGEDKKKLVVVEEVEEGDAIKEQEVDEIKTDEEIIAETKEERAPEDSGEHGEEPQQKKEDDELEDYQEKSGGLMWVIVLTALLVGALAGGFITYFSGVSRLEKPVPTTSPEATMIAATPTPAAQVEELKREDLKVQILNGSGVAGAAGKAKTALEKLGYKNVEAGNAATSDFANTEISILKAKENYLDLVKKDLETEKYTLSATVKTLPTSSKYDVVITLGKK